MEIVQAAEQTIEVFENDIEYYLKEFKEKQNIEDFRTVPQSVWNGALRYIYDRVFKNNKDALKQTNNIFVKGNIIPSNYNAYNYNILLDIADYYIYNMCMVNNKEVSILGFSTLTGIDESVIYDWANGERGTLSTSSAMIYKKLHHYREESLSNKLADGKQNPVGVIAMLNRHYGWASPYTADSRKQAGATTLEELRGKIEALGTRKPVEQLPEALKSGN